jgi:mono/diheme cytochrome c family protein
MSNTIRAAAKLATAAFLFSTAITNGSGQPSKTVFQSSMERGQKVYADRCLTCHFADGGGVQRLNPPLIKTKWVLGDKTVLVQIILKGMNGEVEINGGIYHNVMAPQTDLSDLQIADVLTYIRNSFGNKAKAITPAEVSAIRKKPVKTP